MKQYWEINSLNKVKSSLLSMQQNEDVIKELHILDSFINYGEISFDEVITKNIGSKSIGNRIMYDNKTLNDYNDYLQYIIDFSKDNVGSLAPNGKLHAIDHETDIVFWTIDNFFRSLDKEWFDTYQTLKNDFKNNICISKDRSFSFYLPNANQWYANLMFDSTITDFINTAHEYAHGIIDIERHEASNYSPKNILLELFPLFIELLLCDYIGNNSSIRNEANFYKELQIYSYAIDSDIIGTKYLISQLGSTNPLLISLKLLFKDNVLLRADTIKELYKSSCLERISYTFPFIIALKFYELYQIDKDECVYKMKKATMSTEEPLETLKKLKLIK